MAKISITGQQVMSPNGLFSSGDVLTSPPHSIEFLRHLVDDCGAAVWVEEPAPENKMETTERLVKKSPSTPSSQPERVSGPKTRGSRIGKRSASS